jgi:hypothetical protein
MEAHFDLFDLEELGGMGKLAKRLLVSTVAVTCSLVWSGSSAQAATGGATWDSKGCLLSLFESDIGSLTATSGTCDGDNFWRGTVKDNQATHDGHCVSAWLDGILMATSCNSSGFSFTFHDPQGNHSAFTQVCLDSVRSKCIGASNVGF